MITGFKDNARSSQVKVEPATVQYVNKYRTGVDTVANIAYYAVASDTVEAGSTESVINATGHSAKVGYAIEFTSGTLSGDQVFVQSVTTDTITLSQKLSSAPATNVTFDILVPKFLRANSSGAITLNGPLTVNQGTPLSSGSGWRITEYGVLGLPNFYWNIGGLGILEVPTCVIGDPNSGSPWTFLNGAGAIHGSAAHDAVDNNNPVKIGGRAITSGTTSPSAVAVGDRTDAFFDTEGFQHVKDHSQTDGGTDLTALNVTFDNVTTTATSGTVIPTGYRFADFYFSLRSGGVGTHYVTITLESRIGGNYFTSRCGYLGKLIYEDTATATQQDIHLRFPCPNADAIRITITATNTTALLTFIVDNAHLRLST